ncbi:MAG TPA: FtsX-like permease family protein [Gemmatimonadaceae bacterium]|nr:FtsX-like permease family protein [Gemmatimonadaceae bacterium]
MRLDSMPHSLRTLARHKQFTAMAIVCLGLAIGLNTTMYSVLDAVISPRIDLPHPERLYHLRYYGDYRGLIPGSERSTAIRDGVTFHEGVTGSMPNGGMAERGGQLRAVTIEVVLPNYFAVLGTTATAGRLFNETDQGAEVRPIVITERLRAQLFAGRDAFAPSIIHVDGEPRQVVGVVSQSSALPGSRTDLWLLATPDDQRIQHFGIVRMKPTATFAQAQAELLTVAQRFRQRTGEGAEAGFRLSSAIQPPYRDWGFQLALIGSVAAVLLIACANLANLQLARGVSRARELATRSAVGASRSDIVRQLVLESSWLAGGGLVLGAILTYWGIQLIEASVPKAIAEYMSYPQVSWRVVAFAIGATLLSLLLVGLLPAIRLSRVDISELLKSGAGTGRTKSARRQYGTLVVVEVALALALLCGAGLLVQATLQVHAADLSDDYRGVVYGGARVSRAHAADTRTRYQWSEALIRQALATDSITAAATRTRGCPSRKAIAAYSADGRPRSYFAPMYCYSIVSADYFRVTRMKIIEGRDFAPGEFGEVQVIVDRRAANLLWPGESPIGKQIKLDSAQVSGPWYRVIGVMQPPPPRFRTTQDLPPLDFRLNSRELMKAEGAGPLFSGEIYALNVMDTATIPVADRRGPIFRGGDYIPLIANGRGDPRRLPGSLRAKLGEMGPNVLPLYPQTWEQAMGIDVLKAKHGFMASLFSVFALFALVLAALGVYAIIAHMVAQRRREFGVRIAIGAAERDIREMVLREGNVLTLTGIAIGLLITWKTAGLLRAFVFSDWDRYDSRVFGVVVVVLFAAAWLASYLPARRAMRINPVEALRND